MTKNDIISMASDAGISNNGEDLSFWDVEELQRFAAVVAAAEREACAELCELWNTTPGSKLAAAIRSRNNNI